MACLALGSSYARAPDRARGSSASQDDGRMPGVGLSERRLSTTLRVMRRALVVVMLMWLVLVLSEGAAPERVPDETRRWDPARAAKYLDDRMETWLVAKRRKAGNDETTCVSCHTTVAYVMARPSLRRMMHVSGPTAQEARVL